MRTLSDYGFSRSAFSILVGSVCLLLATERAALAGMGTLPVGAAAGVPTAPNREHAQESQPTPPRTDPHAASPALDTGETEGEAPPTLTTKIRIELSIDTQWDSSRAHDLFSGARTTPRFGAAASYELFELGPRLVLAPGFGAAGDALERGVGPYADALGSRRLSSGTFYGALTLRHHTLSWLSPELRLALGVSFLDMHFSAPESEPFGDQSTVFYSSLGAGAVIHTPGALFRKARFSAGILVEGGVSYETPSDMRLAVEDEETRTPVVDTSLGVLQRMGPYVRVSPLVRF